MKNMLIMTFALTTICGGSEKYDIALTRHLLLIVKQDGKL